MSVGGPIDREDPGPDARDETIWLDPPPQSSPNAPASPEVVLPHGDDVAPPAPASPTRRRRRLIALGAAALAVAAGIVALRSGVDPPLPPVTTPDGQVIRAFHDPALVQPPLPPESPPPPPGEIRSDQRHGGATVWWPPSPHGYEVRWGPAGQEPTESRLVTSPGTTFSGLRPGRYRVDVRSVDEVGQRSEPRSTEFDVADGAPAWTAGLGFAEDLQVDGAIDHDRWLLPSEVTACLRRAPGGPLVVGDHCGAAVSPTSRLRLGEPDADGVRGRVVVVTDTPPAPPRVGNQQPPDDMWFPSGLLVTLSASDSGGWDDQTVTLLLGQRAAHLGRQDQGLDAAPGSAEFANGPGVLHRWELVFTTDEVIALRNGERIVSRPFDASWTEARVGLQVVGDGIDTGVSSNARIAFVGLTGDRPDGRPTTTSRPFVDTGRQVPSLAGRVEPIPSAESAVLSGVAARYPGDGPSSGDLPPLQLVVAVDGVPVPDVRQTPSASPHDTITPFTAVVPIDALRRGAELSISTADGTSIQIFDSRLDVTHRAGSAVPAPVLAGVYHRPDRTFTRPAVIVRRNGTIVNGGEAFDAGPVEVEVRVDAALADGTDQGAMGWLALRVELDGKRILDVPTATDGGSAALGVYRFTIDLSDVDSDYQQLVVRVVPDRAGVTPTTERVTLRSRR